MRHRLLAAWFLISIAVFVVVPFVATRNQVHAGSADNVSGWAWSSNIGWISMNSTNDHDPDTAGVQESAIDYGVDVDADGNLSGYAWSEHIGWISFEETTGCPGGTANPTCAPKIDKTVWQLRGWARACAGTVNGDCTGGDRTDGWDGWISLYGESASSIALYAVPIIDCDWTGYAWGGPVVGWITWDSDIDHDATTPGIQTAPVAYGVVGTGDACQSVPDPECSDATDNADPEDTLADIQDPGCYDTGAYSTTDNDETDTLPQCSNFFDDDGDGERDINEPGCYDSGAYDPNDNDENETLPDCSNFFDDDGDGVSDGGDAGCYDTGGYNANDSSETDTLPQCSNFFDDDGDGQIDHPADTGCVDASDTSEGIAECSDTIDNDGDGLTDENDPGCWDDPLDPTTYNPNKSSERRIRIIEILPE